MDESPSTPAAISRVEAEAPVPSYIAKATVLVAADWAKKIFEKVAVIWSSPAPVAIGVMSGILWLISAGCGANPDGCSESAAVIVGAKHWFGGVALAALGPYALYGTYKIVPFLAVGAYRALVSVPRNFRKQVAEKAAQLQLQAGRKNVE